MSQHKSVSRIAAFMVLVAAGSAYPATIGAEAYRFMTVNTLAESLADSSRVFVEFGMPFDADSHFNGTYSETGFGGLWTGSFGGSAVHATYTGTLTGTEGSDVIVNYSAVGTLGTDPLTITGQTHWQWDPSINDWQNMDFDADGHAFGASRGGKPGWKTRAAELIVGGGLGGWFGGVWGAIKGAGAAYVISNYATDFLKGEDPPPPVRPPRPQPPPTYPEQGKTVNLNIITNGGVTNVTVSSGTTVNLNSVNNGGVVNIVVNPAPGSMALLSMGAGLLAVRRRRPVF